MLENVEVLYHSSIRFEKEKIIYVDPFKINKEYHDADIIFITHSHFDHFSKEDILKVKKEDTSIVIPYDLIEDAEDLGFKREDIIEVKPNETKMVKEILFSTVNAYNINKKFHPKENNWVGYIIELSGINYYIAGDTDITEENKTVKCDVAFVPVGGTYTMNYSEAADLVYMIKPKIAVPIHYGSVVGTKEDGKKFLKLLDSKIEGVILLK